MSDPIDVHEEHVWAQENIAAYVVGGLDPGERDRLETHAVDCAACRQAIEQTRALERKMAACFTAADPGPTLEDRVILALPAACGRKPFTIALPRRPGVLAFVAASIALAATGAVVMGMMEGHYLEFPDRLLALRAKKAPLPGQIGLAAQNMRAGDAQRNVLGTDWMDSSASMEGANQQDPGMAPRNKSDLRPTVPAQPGGGAAVKSETPSTPPGFVTPSLRPNFMPPAASKPASGPVLVGGASGAKDAPVNTLGLQVPGNTATGISTGSTTAGFGYGAGGLGANPYVQPGTTPSLQIPPQLAAQTYFKPGDDLGRAATESKKADDKSLGDRERRAGQMEVAQDTKLGKKPAAEQPAQPEAAGRKIIRSGEIEFEIDSFDNSVTLIMRLVSATKGGFVATINSDKLANGKVRGSIVVRVPPEQLDKFVLDLRKELGKHGELKNQRIGSQDITKQYTDIESRLRAARTMEERLLHIIKEGKGAIKDLLQAEKELGVWRTKIEEMEGELRYYSNLVSLSTLTINLYEKDIRVAAAVTESERVQTGIEVEDVEKAHQEALKAITDLKGRVSRSELKQHAAGQFNALLHFEVSPESTGPMRDRLKQLGIMVRLQIDRVQQTSNGGPAPKDAKVERGPTQFIVDIYNLANVAPRETVLLRIASSDVPGEYLKLRELVSKSKGRVINAQLNQQDRQNIGAQLDFDVRRASVVDIQAALAESGETLSRQVNRIPESDNVTDSKVQYRLSLVDAAAIPARENVTMRIAAGDVPAAYQKLVEALGKAKARVHKADLNEQDRRNITAVLAFDLSRSEQAGVQAALSAAGEVLSRQANRQPEGINVTDTRVAFQVDLSPAEAIAPREITQLSLEARDVSGTLAVLTAQAKEARGRILGSPETMLSENGQMSGRATFDVPLAEAGSLVEKFKAAGQLRGYKMTPNPQAPDGRLALARIDVAVSNAPLLIPSDQGLWSQIRNGLAFSLRGLSISASWLIVGLLFVLPWLLVLYVVVLLARRLFRGVAVAEAGSGAATPERGASAP
jgi:hypothetical protein